MVYFNYNLNSNYKMQT
uniref:Uncharacterized protein n=1 Tax=Anguilla anguilla TaxID=7936 RepID=A0A0E9VWV8_ANGAN